MTIASSPYMHARLDLTCRDEQETAALATMVARFALAGDLIRLEGDLGAGKSTFARYFLKALGYAGDAPSPTYTIVQLYTPGDTPAQQPTGRLPVAHVDAYRLNDPVELEGLGLEVFREHGVIIAEWPDKGGELLAVREDYLAYHIQEMNNPGVLTIALTPGETPHARKVQLTGSRSWQRRYGLMFDHVLRERTESGRTAFLDGLGLDGYQIEDLGADWSFRSYWRVRLPDGPSRMLMDAPPPIEGVQEFADVAAYYRSVGLRAPKEYGRDVRDGYLLLEDFGSRHLLAAAAQGIDGTPWYQVAVDVLCTLCDAAPMPGGRVFSPRDWWIDAARFTDWYMPMVTGRATSVDERARFMDLWMRLYPAVAAMPQGTLPWDYQATNMLLLGETPTIENFGLIDIQDARTAPIAMDLAILLRDIRRPQDDRLETAMLAHAAERLNLPEDDLRSTLDIASLHHCCRILGGLSRLALRDGRTSAAQRLLTRTWQVAHQSYANPLLADIVAFIAPFEAPGVAWVNNPPHTAGVANPFKAA